MYTSAIREGKILNTPEVQEACAWLLDDSASVEERAEFLDALHVRGETAGEVASFVETLLEAAIRPELPANYAELPSLDICGTGGDRAGFFNVSTASMFVTSACGATVVKHGNRGITSKSGGADALLALGLQLDLAPDRIPECLERTGCAFLFAPLYHPAFKAVAPVRQHLAAQGKISIFNLLGPLLNPARPRFQFTGVFSADLLDIYTAVLPKIGREQAWVVHGTLPDGRPLDELTTIGSNQIRITDSHGVIECREYPQNPDPELIPRLQGGSPTENARLIETLLDNDAPDAVKDLVLLNAAGALCAARLQPDLETAKMAAREAIESGRARQVLDILRSIHGRHAAAS